MGEEKWRCSNVGYSQLYLMQKQKFDPDKLSYENDEKNHRMYMMYDGIEGRGLVPTTLLQELTQLSLKGEGKPPEYYFTWEFVKKCIEHDGQL